MGNFLEKKLAQVATAVEGTVNAVPWRSLDVNAAGALLLNVDGVKRAAISLDELTLLMGRGVQPVIVEDAIYVSDVWREKLNAQRD